MTRFESGVKNISFPAERVYGFISDFDHMEDVLPSDKIKNWQSSKDSCRFEVDKIGQIGLKIIEKIPDDTVKYAADGKVPFNFFLWVQLKNVDENHSKVKVTLDAELNPMIKMVAKKPLKKFVERLAEGIAEHKYND